MKVTIINNTVDAVDAISDAMDVTRGHINDENEYVDISTARAEFLKLAKLGHWSVFEHATFTFLIEGVSRVTQQQLTRHRMASFSIESQRHSKIEGSDIVVVPWTIGSNDEAVGLWNEIVPEIFKAYEKLIAIGVPMEDARYLLPEGSTGAIIMTMNVRELYHFFHLRLAAGAQWEIRKLAGEMFHQLEQSWGAIFNNEILAYAE